MSISVRNIIIDRPTKANNPSVYQIERLSFSMEDKVDFPFVMGKIDNIISSNFPNQPGVKNRYKIIEQPLINDAGILKQVVNIGVNGWYFVVLPRGTIFEQLILNPDDLDIDLYISEQDNCLFYSFYNSTTDKISISGKVIKDSRGVYSKIKANMDDLELRQYYLKSCLAKTIEPGEYTELVPELMNMDEAARYLGITKRTLYNWVSDKKIPFTKVGGKNKFRKPDLDQYLENQTQKPKTGRSGRKR